MLTEKQEKRIADLVLKEKKTKAEVGRLFGVSPRTVGRAIERVALRSGTPATNEASTKTASPVTKAVAPKTKKELPATTQAIKYSAVANHNSITIFAGAESSTITSEDQRFTELMARLVNEGLTQPVLASVYREISVKAKIESFNIDKLVVDTDKVEIRYDGYALPLPLEKRMLAMIENGEQDNLARLSKFAEKLMQNPSYNAVNDLYSFLEAADIEIDEDGYVICFKRVNANYTDCYSGKFDNSPGKEVRIPRNQVDPDNTNTCSKGLHVCSKKYLNHYRGDKIVRCKVSPADFVAVPSDYNNSKARVTGYTVIDDVTNTLKY